LLETHSSTKERLGFYPELYQRIFTTAMVPKTILDLGCGINPLSLKYMKLKEINYYAYDISEKEVAIINKFFQEEKKVHAKINGKAEVMDISKIEALKKLPPAEICFLFKITDILDNGKGHKVTEAVIQAVPAKYFIISFPTKTMSGKPMNAPRRKWMEWLCKRLGYHYTLLEFDNEIFYVVNKHG
jgi:16S rRNA (guanine(1405)-N(7))-methyltransferase